MKIKVTYDKEKLDKELELDDKATVKDLLDELNINPVTVIVAKEKTVVLEDEPLENGNEIKIMSVISGG